MTSTKLKYPIRFLFLLLQRQLSLNMHRAFVVSSTGPALSSKLNPVVSAHNSRGQNSFFAITTGSASALCRGFGLQRSFSRNILELLVYYLMPNKCKNLKDMKSYCLLQRSVLDGKKVD